MEFVWILSFCGPWMCLKFYLITLLWLWFRHKKILGKEDIMVWFQRPGFVAWKTSTNLGLKVVSEQGPTNSSSSEYESQRLQVTADLCHFYCGNVDMISVKQEFNVSVV